MTFSRGNKVRVIRSLLLWAMYPAIPAAAQRTLIMPASCTELASGKPVAGLVWRGSTTDVEWAEWPVSLGVRRVPAKIIVARIDPARVQMSLEIARDGGSLMPWTIDNAPLNASIAFNAGQFTDDGPWGWVVHRGKEMQKPGAGALAGAVVVDTGGRVQVVNSRKLTALRSSASVAEAVQSYPMLLEDNATVDRALCTDAVDESHRDTRLAIGVLPDGRVLVAMSRYDGAGEVASRIPIGPTNLEMAEVLRRLGAQSALMLDGGLSAQLLIREHGANDQKWRGLRGVPLALVGRARQ